MAQTEREVVDDDDMRVSAWSWKNSQRKLGETKTLDDKDKRKAGHARQ